MTVILLVIVDICTSTALGSLNHDNNHSSVFDSKSAYSWKTLSFLRAWQNKAFRRSRRAMVWLFILSIVCFSYKEKLTFNWCILICSVFWALYINTVVYNTIPIISHFKLKMKILGLINLFRFIIKWRYLTADWFKMSLYHKLC